MPASSASAAALVIHAFMANLLLNNLADLPPCCDARARRGHPMQTGECASSSAWSAEGRAAMHLDNAPYGDVIRFQHEFLFSAGAKPFVCTAHPHTHPHHPHIPFLR